MSDLSKSHLEKLLKELAILGEDQTELNLWSGIYDELSDQEKEDLIANLEKEIKLFKA